MKLFSRANSNKKHNKIRTKTDSFVAQKLNDSQKEKILTQGAKDFSDRFEGVMRELANG